MLDNEKIVNILIIVLCILLIMMGFAIAKPINALKEYQNNPQIGDEQTAKHIHNNQIRSEEESVALFNTLEMTLADKEESVEQGTETRSVIFSNYHVGDRTGEVDKTKSGLKSRDFQINDMGWHTYNGCVVISAAHRDMGTVRDGYRYHEIGELINFTFDNCDYCGIVLDTGSAMLGWGNETEQRYDIRVSHEKYDFGLVKGTILENVEVASSISMEPSRGK